MWEPCKALACSSHRLRYRPCSPRPGPWGSLTPASSVPAPLSFVCARPPVGLALCHPPLLAPSRHHCRLLPSPTPPCLNPSEPQAAPDRPWPPQQCASGDASELRVSLLLPKPPEAVPHPPEHYGSWVCVSLVFPSVCACVWVCVCSGFPQSHVWGMCCLCRAEGGGGAGRQQSTKKRPRQAGRQQTGGLPEHLRPPPLGY